MKMARATRASPRRSRWRWSSPEEAGHEGRFGGDCGLRRGRWAGLRAPVEALVRGLLGFFRVVAIPCARSTPVAGSLHFSVRRRRTLCIVAERVPRVLVVEDDEEIASVLQRSLRMEGYEAEVCGDGSEALTHNRTFNPDLVVLDLGLPGLDGMEVARLLREEAAGDVPILMLTARDAVESRVEGLDAGADDYLVKPFEREELLARIRALLRRRPPRGSASLSVGDLELNPDRHEVRRGDREIGLTQREFELLEFLMRNERIVIARQQLLEDIWGYDPFADTNTIEVFVSNLRRKLEAGGEPRILHTIRGAGYVLRA